MQSAKTAVEDFDPNHPDVQALVSTLDAAFIAHCRAHPNTHAILILMGATVFLARVVLRALNAWGDVLAFNGRAVHIPATVLSTLANTISLNSPDTTASVSMEIEPSSVPRPHRGQGVARD